MDVRQTDAFAAWFRGLRDQTAKDKINVRLLRLMRGNTGDTAAVGGGISELRIHHGPGYRVYYIRRGDAWIVLFGGDKADQGRDVKRALALAAQAEN